VPGPARAAAIAYRLWPDADVSIVPLAGGITNENYKVTVGADTCVIRIFGQDAELLLIDRTAECEITATAARIGVGPELVAALLDEGALVTRFIPGRLIPATDMADPEVLHRVADALRRVHAISAAPKSLHPFRDVDSYAAGARQRRVPTHPDFGRGITLTSEIERLVGYSPSALCHGDLLNSNFIQAGDNVYIVDWEYAGLGDPLFDLANMSVNHKFSPDADAVLLGLCQGHAREPDLAKIRLLRFVSAAREAAWSYLQLAISALDVDFSSYADACLDNMREAADEQSFQEALRLLRRNPVRGPAA
jgi:thiamine kinase-like enzyme